MESSTAARSMNSRVISVPASACRAELAELEQLRGALRALPRHRAPAELRARLAASTDLPALEPARTAPQGTTWRVAAALLLGIAIGVSAMVWSGRGSGGLDSGTLLARDLLAGHLRALAANSAIDVVSEDRHTVKPWFAGKIGESPPVVDPKAEDFLLLGGRIDYVGGRRTAVVVYGHRKHVIDVFMTPEIGGCARLGVTGLRNHALPSRRSAGVDRQRHRCRVAAAIHGASGMRRLTRTRQAKMGWPMGLEPTTAEITTRGSTS